MIWLVLLLLVLMLTRSLTTGNTQSNGKKLPITLIRNNTSSRDASGAKPTASPGRPATAIDPLSHVRSRYMQLPCMHCHQWLSKFVAQRCLLMCCSSRNNLNSICSSLCECSVSYSTLKGSFAPRVLTTSIVVEHGRCA